MQQITSAQKFDTEEMKTLKEENENFNKDNERRNNTFEIEYGSNG